MTAPVTSLDLLYTLADDLIATAGDVLAEAGIPAPPDTARAVDVGLTAAVSFPVGLENVCDGQLNCTVVGPQPRRGASNARGLPAYVWEVVLRLALFRCHLPGLSEEEQLNPPADKVAELALEDLRDRWQLARGLARRQSLADGTPTNPGLFPSLPAIGLCPVTFGDFQGLGPQGGMRGVVLPVTVGLEMIGYDPDNPAG